MSDDRAGRAGGPAVDPICVDAKYVPEWGRDIRPMRSTASPVSGASLVQERGGLLADLEEQMGEAADRLGLLVGRTEQMANKHFGVESVPDGREEPDPDRSGHSAARLREKIELINSRLDWLSRQIDRLSRL